MAISSVIAQLRKTNLGQSIRFSTEKGGLTLAFQYENFYADDQGHILYFGEPREGRPDR